MAKRKPAGGRLRRKSRLLRKHIKYQLNQLWLEQADLRKSIQKIFEYIQQTNEELSA